MLFACAGCLRNAAIDWPMWYEGYIPYETMPLSVFLREKIRSGEVEYKIPLNYKFTYHDPCHNGTASDAPERKGLGLRGTA